MKINRIIFDKLKLKWEILKYGAIEIQIQHKIDQVVDDELKRDVFGNTKFSEKDMIYERLLEIKHKIPVLLEKEEYEELSRIKKIYNQLLIKYKKL